MCYQISLSSFIPIKEKSKCVTALIGWLSLTDPQLQENKNQYLLFYLGIWCVLASFMSIWHELVIWQKGTQIVKMSLWDSAVDRQACSALIISDWEGRTLPIVGGDNPGLVILGFLRKQAEQAVRNKPIISTLLWSMHQLLPICSALFEYLTWLPSMNCDSTSVNQI